jgi:ATP-dependent RNA helicase SUPV3L1/SUV3
MSFDMETRIRNVTAVLGPTNTGKTFLAIERMLGHETGMIGLPLRLLAREVYDKIAARVGPGNVALITGEEKIKPENARYFVCTVEAMPRDVTVDFLAIDEVQLAADPERGHVFTDRLLHARGKLETLLLGAGTMRDAIGDLIPGANFISRPRLSKLTYAGEKKITRLPPRTAVVAFSANEVYSIAELIRRQRGGAAVVLGALSPRTRNAQVALYQSGDVDFMIATDAIGMGLNLDVDHVAFAAMRKFDGHVHRELTPSEIGQIAGRAGRHMNDGTFGVTAGVEALTPDLIERLENHQFDPVKVLQWRTRELDFASLDALRDSLRKTPREGRLARARMSDDTLALEAVSADRDVVSLADTRINVAKLWDVCQLPDYRKISTQNHAELVGTIFKFLRSGDERIPEDWFAKQVAFADRTDGDIDTLSNRIAHIRTWTFVSNRPDWLRDPGHWQERTRQIEDTLSDALHICLTQRFVDKRTSALMRGLRDKDDLSADIADDGTIKVENHFVGRLRGFRFEPDTSAAVDGVNAKAMRTAAAHVVAKELVMRARRVASAKPDAFKLTRRGMITWRGDDVARLEKGDDPLRPQLVLLADEHLTGPDRERVQERLNTWITEAIGERLKPLVEIAKAEDVTGLARGIAFRMKENFGVLRREAVAEEIKTLDQTARSQLRKYGVRFGAFNIYFPTLLKPVASDMALSLWALDAADKHGLSPETLPEPPRAGLTSLPADPKTPEAFYRTAGFQLCGPRAVRIDMLERLADTIRPLLAWRRDAAAPDAVAPKGSTGDGGFTATPDMMSILGCSADELGHVLRALGFRLDRRPVAAPANAATEPPPVQAEPPPATEASTLPAANSDTEIQPSEAAAPPVNVVPAVSVADATGATATPAEPQFIDIWRPRRRRTDDRGQRQSRPEHRRQRGRRHDAQPTTASVAAAPAAEAAPKPERTDKPWRRDKERDSKREDRPRRDEQRRQGGHEGKRDRPWTRRDERGGGQGRGRDGGGRPPVMISAVPPKSRGADADNPFAALSALKAKLEQSTKE